MISFRKKAEKVSRPLEQKPKSPSRPLRMFFLPAVVVITLVMLVSGVGSIMVVGGVREQAAIEQARLGAAALAMRIRVELEHHRQMLLALARSPRLARALTAEPRLGRLGQDATAVFAGVSEVRILPDDYDAPGSELLGSLSYASLDLLQAAARSEEPPPAEVHQFGSDDAYIALAVKMVGAGASPGGFILATLPLAWLSERMRPAAAEGQALAVQQLLRGKAPLTIASTSASAAQGAAPDGILPVPGSIWQVAYWRGATSAAAGSYSALALWTILGLAWAAILASLLLQYQRERRALCDDLGLFADLLDRVVSRQPLRRSPARISEIQAQLDLLREQVKAPAMPDLGSGGLAPDEPPISVLSEEPAPPAPVHSLPAEIFRQYDIRGVVGGNLTLETMVLIGRALGTELRDRGQRTLIAGRDGRNSSTELAQAFQLGVLASGCDLIDLGQVPTPVVYFATHFLGSDSGAMITGSHNPPEYNGVKIVLGGESLSPEAIQALRERIESQDFERGDGVAHPQDLIPDYVERVIDDVNLARPMKIIVDCGNGVAGVAALPALRQLGCEVAPLFCDIDGNFPNHHPDPGQPANLQALASEVVQQGADLGLAFDGDGDRLGVVDSRGKIIWPDRLLMLLATEVLSARPGADIVYDVKCSRHLAEHVRAYGGCPIVIRTGHSFLKAKVRETGAPLAGELSGHIIFRDRWYGFDDAVYAAARVLELLSMDPRPSAEVFSDLPESPSTPELVAPCGEGEAQALMRKMASQADFPGAAVTRVDGIRAEYADGWGLVRASNTTPSLIFRFEAESEERIAEIQEQFRDAMRLVAPELELPF